MALLELRDVHKTFAGSAGDVAALRGVDLVVDRGAYVVLDGPSGAGKTTLLHVAGLLEPPTRGAVSYDGRDATRLSSRETAALRLREVGFVFQHHYLAPDLTVEENVALPALALGRADAAERTRELLARVGLAGAAARLPRELSGGEQQRAGIARALVNAPRLLVADEPTGDLDPASADVVAALLADAHAQGATLLVVTHDSAQFPQATARATLRAGRLEAAIRAATPR